VSLSCGEKKDARQLRESTRGSLKLAIAGPIMDYRRMQNKRHDHQNGFGPQQLVQLFSAHTCDGPGSHGENLAHFESQIWLQLAIF